MRSSALVLLFLSFVFPAASQLTPEQKIMDFQQLAGLYVKQYGPYEWKRDVLRFDLMDLKPWLQRIEASASDIEFYEIMSEYVASLRDAHAAYYLPSTFWADAGLRADIYDGKVLIDVVNRSLLPRADYPFDVGDEIVSVDGKPAMDLIKELARFSSYANSRSTLRYAAHWIGIRDQVIYPRAYEIGDTSTFVIRRDGGELETYQLKWNKHGRALTTNGKVPNPRRADGDDPEGRPIAFAPAPEAVPHYMHPLAALGRNYISKPMALRNFGSRAPVFTIANFTVRLGRSSSDPFYTGTYVSEGQRIGFIRIPHFSPVSQFAALLLLDREIAYMRQNTDGLVVDIMRNPGGNGCYAEEVMRRFIPRPFGTMAYSVRATLQWVNAFDEAIQIAKDEEAEEWEINLLSSFRDMLEAAFAENRGLTGALPLCSLGYERDPVRDREGTSIAYEKPLIVLTDEFTTSA
ncbi:MAG TPA: S41 family peptidase, partial [Bryobacteraceae bacterium]|nr:S41 family peptidase [Bryobacteraceae bacterium]